jgi:hypothetical protein
MMVVNELSLPLLGRFEFSFFHYINMCFNSLCISLILNEFEKSTMAIMINLS